jgi:hypothetical protein
MDLSKILAISGKPGLYKMISQTKSGFIVESLADGKRFPVFAHERVSSLEEISIFTTTEDDLPLKKVFRKIHTKTEGKPAPDPSSGNETVKKFFLEAIPEYDPERVYVSDMKKALAWYNILVEKEMMDLSEDEEMKEDESDKVEQENKEDEQPGEVS